ncbi:MAG: hypothetical protein IJ466_09525 [Clostridia bacterium]|nr:hypothetical protein [Clostridia bacterium]
MKKILALLTALLLLCAGLALAESAATQEITLPLNTRFYPTASFGEIANYEIVSQPEGASVASGWSWLRLEESGDYLLRCYDASGAESMLLTIHAAEEAPALLGVTVSEDAEDLGLSFACTESGFTVSAASAAEITVLDKNGNLLGTNGAEIDPALVPMEIELAVPANGSETRVPATVSLAYPCLTCGVSPLSADYNIENHVVGYCGHWLCTETGNVHNNKCVCGDYLCNGEDHSDCIEPCPACGADVNAEDYVPTKHAPCPACGEIYICDPDFDLYIHGRHTCNRYSCVGNHDDCAHCGLAVCTTYSNPWTVTIFPEDHTNYAPCGHLRCVVNYATHYGDGEQVHALLECGRYACDGHDHAKCTEPCPGCGENVNSEDYVAEEHAIHTSCGQYSCVGEHGRCPNCVLDVCADITVSGNTILTPADHKSFAACGHARCLVNIDISAGGNTTAHSQLDCGLYACDGHDHSKCFELCPGCGENTAADGFNSQEHSLCGNCSQYICNGEAHNKENCGRHYACDGIEGFHGKISKLLGVDSCEPHHACTVNGNYEPHITKLSCPGCGRTKFQCQMKTCGLHCVECGMGMSHDSCGAEPEATPEPEVPADPETTPEPEA